MPIDVFLLLLIALSVWKGLNRGLIVAVFSFVAIVAGLAAAVKLSAVVAGWLQQQTHIGAGWLPFVSFALVLVGVVLAIRFVATLLQKAVELLLMGWVNKIGGIVLYAFVFIMIYSVVLFYATQMQLLTVQTIAASKTYAFIEPLGPKVIEAMGKIIPFFKGMFSQLETFFASVHK